MFCQKEDKAIRHREPPSVRLCARSFRTLASLHPQKNTMTELLGHYMDEKWRLRSNYLLKVNAVLNKL